MSTISSDTLVLILKYFFPLGLFGFWASSLARVSIGGMLLRFDISKAWKVVIWIAVVIQLCMPVAADIFILLQCRPIRAMWEPVPAAVCWSPAKSQIFGYIYSGLHSTYPYFCSTLTCKSRGYHKRSCFCHHANVLYLDAAPAKSRTSSYQRIDGPWVYCCCGRGHEDVLYQVLESARRAYAPGLGATVVVVQS